MQLPVRMPAVRENALSTTPPRRGGTSAVPAQNVEPAGCCVWAGPVCVVESPLCL